MEVTVRLTDEEMEALKRAFPGCEPEEAAAMLLKDEMRKRYRIQLRRAQLSLVKGLKRD